MKENKSVNVHNLIILDESGSMSSIYRETLSAINETLSTIRLAQKDHPKQHHFVSIITFKGFGMESIKVRRDRVDINVVEDFSDNDYNPAGLTPLYDAMGLGITKLERNISDDDRVMVTIITDGLENTSKEYTYKTVTDLVSRQKEKGWTFAYIGANQDSEAVAEDLNIDNALDFEATTAGVKKMCYRLSNALLCCFCDIENEKRPTSSNRIFSRRVK